MPPGFGNDIGNIAITGTCIINYIAQVAPPEVILLSFIILKGAAHMVQPCFHPVFR